MVAVEARGQPPAAPKWSPKKVWLSLLLALPENPFSDSKHVWIFIAEESLKEIYFLGKSFLFLFSPLHRRFLFSNLLLAVYYLTIPSITHLLRPSSQMQRRKKVPFSHCYYYLHPFLSIIEKNFSLPYFIDPFSSFFLAAVATLFKVR